MKKLQGDTLFKSLMHIYPKIYFPQRTHFSDTRRMPMSLRAYYSTSGEQLLRCESLLCQCEKSSTLRVTLPVEINFKPAVDRQPGFRRGCLRLESPTKKMFSRQSGTIKLNITYLKTLCARQNPRISFCISSQTITELISNIMCSF